MFKILLLTLLLSACKLPYKSDVGLMSDGFANMPTAIVEINKNVCKGYCYLVEKKGTDYLIKFNPTAYNYRLDLLTSANVGFEKSFDVIGEKGIEVTIPQSNVDVFNLLGRIYPIELADNVSIFFEARIRQYAPEFISRVTPYLQQGWLIMGADSLFLECDYKVYKEKTTIKNADKCISLSESGRLNSYGY